jgi:hypothetical protein
MTSAVVHADILCDLEAAVFALPEETAENILQETFKILRASFKPNDKLTLEEFRCRWVLEAK